ncbi:MAG: fused response regulator/phosphatase [Chlorobi bacterium]|nr:fused response regulator/phosphatase [Chlorobiota bacterium]
MERCIVVVDDSTEFLVMVELALEPIATERHLQILHASSGEEALALLANNPNAAVLLTDLAMPRMDGLALITQCRRQYPLLQSVVLSGASDARSIIEALRAGASDYIVKPPSIAELETSLSNALARYEELEQTFRTRERLQTYERELAIAAEIQRHMLPPSQVRDPDEQYRLAALLVPARHVAGDFYDHWVTGDGRIVMIVGDVSGKGVSAALWMAVTKTLLRSHLEHESSPVEAMEATNRALAMNNPQAYFVTAVVAIFDPEEGLLSMCNAAHPSPYHIRHDGAVERLPTIPGMPLGALEDTRYHCTTVEIAPNDRILMYTDGILDALTEDLSAQQSALGNLIRQTSTATDIIASIIAQLSQLWIGQSLPDDVTLLQMDYCPTELSTQKVATSEAIERG